MNARITDTTACELYRSVVENPLDDTTRLALADRLDEISDGTLDPCPQCRGTGGVVVRRSGGKRSRVRPKGKVCPRCDGGKLAKMPFTTAHAALIRAQIALSVLHNAGWHDPSLCNVTGQCAPCGRAVQADKLFDVISPIWHSNCLDFGVQSRLGHRSRFVRTLRWVVALQTRRRYDDTDSMLGNYLPVRRGFIDEIRCRCDVFVQAVEDLEDADTNLFCDHPITKVRLTNRTPQGQSWVRLVVDDPQLMDERPELIPADIFDELPFADAASLLHSDPGWANSPRIEKRYLTPAQAHWALSVACVNYGRRKAGLPSLSIC